MPTRKFFFYKCHVGGELFVVVVGADHSLSVVDLVVQTRLALLGAIKHEELLCFQHARRSAVRRARLERDGRGAHPAIVNVLLARQAHRHNVYAIAHRFLK
jgi:hypothetical protein